MKRLTLILTLLSLLFVFSSCDHNMVFEGSSAIPECNWKSNEPVRIEFEVRDTIALHNFFLTIRNRDEYEFRNLFVFVELEFPNGKISIDTVECVLADPTGKWYGKGGGSLYDNRILFKQDKRFPLAGRYKVSISQGMRKEKLKGICDVGLRLALPR